MIDGERTSRTARSQEGKLDPAGAPSGADPSAGPLFAAEFADSPSSASAPPGVPPTNASGPAGRPLPGSPCAGTPTAGARGAVGALSGSGRAGAQASPTVSSQAAARPTLRIQVRTKPAQHALPGRARRIGVVPSARVVEEAVLGARVDLDLERLAGRGQRGYQIGDCRVDSRVVGGVDPEHRCLDVWH